MKNELINKIKNIEDTEILNKVNFYLSTLINQENKTITDIYTERINSNFYSEEQIKELQNIYKECLNEQQFYKDKLKKLQENDLIIRLITDELKEKYFYEYKN